MLCSVGFTRALNNFGGLFVKAYRLGCAQRLRAPAGPDMPGLLQCAQALTDGAGISCDGLHCDANEQWAHVAFGGTARLFHALQHCKC